MTGNKFINLKTGWIKEKNQEFYPLWTVSSVWTVLQSNQMVDEGKHLLIKFLQLINENKMLEFNVIILQPIMLIINGYYHKRREIRHYMPLIVLLMGWDWICLWISAHMQETQRTENMLNCSMSMWSAKTGYGKL